MSEKVEIRCENVVVKFPLFDVMSRSVRAKLTGNAGIQKVFTALDDLNVTINSGERVGLLGRNGAGKTTFLRMIAGVYVPKSGKLEVNSSTTNLFNVSVGTDPDASGYENIPLLMASRGIPAKMLDEVVADVENFSELGAALARPLRTYSQGMHLRIAFTVATFMSKDILLMDEVLGVGDQGFAEKSKVRIENMMSNVNTLVLASHSPGLLKLHCDRGLVFDAGKIVFDGTIDEAIKFSNEQLHS